MVIKTSSIQGALMTEIVMAMAIFSIALLPIGYSYVHEQNELRVACQRAMAMELLDGELEILRAGEWQNFQLGLQSYNSPLLNANNLPPAAVSLEMTGRHLKLTWVPVKKFASHPIVREADIP